MKASNNNKIAEFKGPRGVISSSSHTRYTAMLRGILLIFKCPYDSLPREPILPRKREPLPTACLAHTLLIWCVSYSE